MSQTFQLQTLGKSIRSVSSIASAAVLNVGYEGIGHEAYVLHRTSAALLCPCSQRHSARILANEWREGLLQMLASRSRRWRHSRSIYSCWREIGLA